MQDTIAQPGALPGDDNDRLGRRTPTVQLSRRRTERLARIHELVTTHGESDVHALASTLGVSLATLRRDLDLLDRQGVVRRTHGGARREGPGGEVPLRFRDTQHREAKSLIARAAADRIPVRPQAIVISGGTTTTEVARHLADRRDLTIVTNAVNIAMELALRPGLKVIIAGGMIRAASHEVVGAWTERFLEGLNFSIAVMGVDGISARGGLTTHDAVEARSNQRMVERADRVLIVADASKVGVVTMSKIADVGRHQTLITDAGAPPEAVASLRDAGMEVVLL